MSSCIPTRSTAPGVISSCTTVRSASGNYDQIDAEHRKILGIDGCGYHFVIGNGTGSRDGQIEVSQRWINQKQGAHTRNARTHDADEYGIGICLVGDFDQQPPSPKQIAATQALIDYLSKRYNIAPDGLRTHAHLAATKTVCPGKFFPSEAMLKVTKDAMTERPVRAPPGRSSATRPRSRRQLPSAIPPHLESRAVRARREADSLTLTLHLRDVEWPRARGP